MIEEKIGPAATTPVQPTEALEEMRRCTNVDEQGYLHLPGRRCEVIIRARENIFPVEVETLTGEHPDVAEAAVVGLRDSVMTGSRRVRHTTQERDHRCRRTPDLRQRTTGALQGTRHSGSGRRLPPKFQRESPEDVPNRDSGVSRAETVIVTILRALTE